MIFSFKKFLPLILVETYLLITVLLLIFGPVKFKIHNPDLTYIFLLLYHLAFCLGYVIATNLSISVERNTEEFRTAKFITLFFFAIFGVLLTYKNLMMSDSILPFNLYKDIVRGIFEPGLVYSERMGIISSGQNLGHTRFLNLISILFLFTKLLFIFYFVFYWNYLGFIKKLLCVAFSLLFIAPGIASGTNSIIFQFTLFLIISVFVILYFKRSRFLMPSLLASLLLFFCSVLFFGYIMSQRGGGFEYFSTTSPLGDISTNMVTPQLEGIFNYFLYSFVWLNYYVLQGYYGFSLIFDVDWNWTFGFGSSDFLQRQLQIIAGIDISEITYQARISHYWDKNAQWHSFYGQFANDFGVLGLVFFMFILGFVFARVWVSAVYGHNFYGAALIPIFIIMFVFMPANNQVFAYIDSLSYIIVVGALWMFSKYRKVC